MRHPALLSPLSCSIPSVPAVGMRIRRSMSTARRSVQHPGSGDHRQSNAVSGGADNDGIHTSVLYHARCVVARLRLALCKAHHCMETFVVELSRLRPSTARGPLHVHNSIKMSATCGAIGTTAFNPHETRARTHEHVTVPSFPAKSFILGKAIRAFPLKRAPLRHVKTLYWKAAGSAGNRPWHLFWPAHCVGTSLIGVRVALQSANLPHHNSGLTPAIPAEESSSRLSVPQSHRSRRVQHSVFGQSAPDLRSAVLPMPATSSNSVPPMDSVVFHEKANAACTTEAVALRPQGWAFISLRPPRNIVVTSVTSDFRPHRRN